MLALTENTAHEIADVTEIQGRKSDQKSAFTGPDADPENFILQSTHTKTEVLDSTAGELSGQESPIDYKAAARKISELTTDEEYERLSNDHRKLVRKSFTEKISRSDELKLQLIRWSLDRIEDAKYGQSLDVFEGIVMAHERVANSIARAAENITKAASSRQRRRKR